MRSILSVELMLWDISSVRKSVQKRKTSAEDLSMTQTEKIIMNSIKYDRDLQISQFLVLWESWDTCAWLWKTERKFNCITTYTSSCNSSDLCWKYSYVRINEQQEHSFSAISNMISDNNESLKIKKSWTSVRDLSFNICQ